MQSQKLCSSAGEGCWVGSLPLQGYRMGSKAAQVLRSGETRGYTKQLGRAVNLLLFLSGVVERAP